MGHVDVPSLHAHHAQASDFAALEMTGTHGEEPNVQSCPVALLAACSIAIFWHLVISGLCQ